MAYVTDYLLKKVFPPALSKRSHCEGRIHRNNLVTVKDTVSCLPKSHFSTPALAGRACLPLCKAGPAPSQSPLQPGHGHAPHSWPTGTEGKRAGVERPSEDNVSLMKVTGRDTAIPAYTGNYGRGAGAGSWDIHLRP